MNEKIRNDFDKLLDYSVSTAEHFLKHQKGEFYPFGVYIDKNCEIVPLAIYEGDEFPLSDTLIEQFNRIFEKQLREGEIMAYCITYDTKVTNDSFPEKIDAVTTRMRHCDSKDVFVYYFPYKIKGEEIEFFESFGEIGNS